MICTINSTGNLENTYSQEYRKHNYHTPTFASSGYFYLCLIVLCLNAIEVDSVWEWKLYRLWFQLNAVCLFGSI